MISVDLARMAEALQRPGIDPRTWTTLAVVTSVNVTETGVYCGILTIAGIEETAALAPEYAGDGFGLYAPIEVEEMVLVAFPEGTPNTGARIIARVWDGGERPPQDVLDHPEDFVIVVKPGASLRLVAQGDGDVIVEAKGGGRVKLGGEDASRGVARKDDTVGMTTASAAAFSAALQVALDARYTVLNPAVPVSVPSGTPIGAILTGSDEVVSK